MVQSTNMLNPYPQQGGANAVAINIYNPQAYGAPASQAQNVPPYAYTNSLYSRMSSLGSGLLAYSFSSI